MDPNSNVVAATMSSAVTPRWNIERPYLTGRFHQEINHSSSSQVSFSSGSDILIGSYPISVQELLIIDDLLFALLGIEGRYISIKRLCGKEPHLLFQIDPSTDLALQELSQRLFPLCKNFISINDFVESKSHFNTGLVNHAFAASLRTLLLDYQAMVAQLEHQFHLGRLSLQGLWFFCQPMMGSMHALSIVIEKLSANNLSGSGTLNLLQSQAKSMAGDNEVRNLLEKMEQSASSAYLHILERWVYEGIIDDPHNEFFISENKSLQKESLTQDYEAKYWQHRYSLKDSIPNFLISTAGTILTTGKYLNVMRECGHNVQVPISDILKITHAGSNHHYIECIKVAHAFASTELLKLIKEKYCLVGKLRSMKRYLLIDQGDFLVHFMDIAQDELAKRPDEISVEKLQSLLGLALRSTAAAVDPCHEELTCCVERVPLLKRLAMLKKRVIPETGQPAFSFDELHEPVNITGLETFCLSYKVRWPLSLVITRKALTKYQLIFRFLFHCKHVNRQLCVAWQLHQGFRMINIVGTVISGSSILCRNMIKFINSLLHYLTFEVLEPNWHLMHDSLKTAKSIDEVIHHHDLFLDKCLKECLLLSPQLIQKMEKLKLICLQYAVAVQQLIPSMCMPPVDSMFSDSIISFEKEFSNGLQSLGPMLNNTCEAEPYLTHLAQSILGDAGDN
ncbi:putative Gamma-tubulin complex component [Zostera marina]|uniref:Gamma-tubulin complex component n=1 Tax=Zostera marina TaxID=29655 RepID=A0A0K9PVY1_ZOSMR|nr:putative Gamma-tubulin complex component [Zostera marina]